MGKIMDKLGEINRQDNTAVRVALKKNGIKFIELNSNERKPWQETAKRAIEELGKEGQYSAEMYSTVQKHLQEFRK